jgi:hypothetical protein
LFLFPKTCNITAILFADVPLQILTCKAHCSSYSSQLCLFLPFVFLMWFLNMLFRLVSNSWIQVILCLSLPSTWNYRPVPPHLTAQIFITAYNNGKMQKPRLWHPLWPQCQWMNIINHIVIDDISECLLCASGHVHAHHTLFNLIIITTL